MALHREVGFDSSLLTELAESVSGAAAVVGAENSSGYAAEPLLLLLRILSSRMSPFFGSISHYWRRDRRQGFGRIAREGIRVIEMLTRGCAAAAPFRSSVGGGGHSWAA